MQLCERKHNIIHYLHSYCRINLILFSFLYFVVRPVFVFLLCICYVYVVCVNPHQHHDGSKVGCF